MSSHEAPPMIVLNSSMGDSNKSVEESIKTSVLMIVLILSFTIILSLTLCLILRHLNRRCLLLSSSSTTTTTTTASSTATASSNRVSPDSLHHSVVDSLPLFTFASIKRRTSSSTTSSSSSAADCAVCLCNFEADDQLRLLPLCCHAFHEHCIGTWLHSNLSCPLCRSPIHASDSDIIKALSPAPPPPPPPAAASSNASRDGRSGSFRLEIGSVSRGREADHEPLGSYSIGSFEYVVEEAFEITVSESHRRTISDKEINGSITEDAAAAHDLSLAEEVASGGRSWLKDYIDRLSSSVSTRAMSFRGSGRFFGGSSRRSDAVSGDYDMEANRVGEEISEFFRWFSGV